MVCFLRHKTSAGIHSPACEEIKPPLAYFMLCLILFYLLSCVPYNENDITGWLVA